ncbi:unnamed protein product [Acanthoscelides obtectus]|uniref:Uncharacterized protein n=1 Tax=Acanthoscelides obtectus TaxID=200917 RepID=A0A9P0QGQ9_ACAOB|nr:unnamed protein product [Acanthoscelides obtectus]CAH2020347.1 unnamed protein product [Acanthoscelides obtectus]CAK1682208.1 hypothetical protein AOBTE_LOCUS33485 [Acanthoscelides obtectus]CAK1683641.1 hypothetical protein AOBTE_LOCUS34375 [Acanthoscelides obtectus]
MSHFSGKTQNQISDKRRLLGWIEPANGPASRTSDRAVLPSPGNQTIKLLEESTINKIMKPQAKCKNRTDDEEKRWKQCMIASAIRTLAKQHDEVAKDFKMQPLAVRLNAIAGSLPLRPLLRNAVVDPVLTYFEQREEKGIVSDTYQQI